MKVKDLVHYLQVNHQPDSEIAVMWFDDQYCIDGLQITAPTREIMEQAWQEISGEAQEILDAHIIFTQTGYEIQELFEQKITELLQEEETNA